MVKRIVTHVRWRIHQFFKIDIKQFVFGLFLPKMVLSGPFKGMLYLNKSTGSVVLPKLIGTYEDELHQLIEQTIVKKSYNQFIDIGAAEGYFAVGFSKYIFKQKIPVIAFELTERGRKMIHQLAHLNKVNNITINGACNIDALLSVLLPKSLILMDVEGFEVELLQPKRINYGETDILVELHPNVHPAIRDEIISRFKATHHITEIFPAEKKLPDIQLPQWLYKRRSLLMNEFRGPQSWLWMEANPS